MDPFSENSQGSAGLRKERMKGDGYREERRGV
jgi:hypothetical protein